MEPQELVHTAPVKERWSLHGPEHVSEKSLPRVVVVGAGMSGLVTARVLRDTGFPVQVVEARERLGGRIWTDTRLGVPCDLGASWIHGVQQNPLTLWCRSRGIGLRRIPKGNTWICEQGKIYRLSLGLWRARRGIARAAYAYIRTFLPLWTQKMRGGNPEDVSITEALDPVCVDPRLGEYDRRVLWWYLGLVEAIEGAPAYELGILEQEVPEYWQTNAVPSGGFKLLIDDAAEGLEIGLGRAVEKITYGSRGVKIVHKGGTLSGDLAVLTLPVGPLRSGAVTFDPPLSPTKQEALSRIGYGGVLNKLALRFPTRFLPLGHERLTTLPTHPRERGIFTLWADFSSATGYPLLIGFASGETAAQLDRSSPDNEICERALSTLDGMFASSLPLPEGYLLTRWLSDPWSQGSYSYCAVGSSGEDRRQLTKPVSDRLFFAGEATHEEHFGTVHGALLSGEREARRIHRRFCCGDEKLAHFPWRKKGS